MKEEVTLNYNVSSFNPSVSRQGLSFICAGDYFFGNAKVSFGIHVEKAEIFGIILFYFRRT